MEGVARKEECSTPGSSNLNGEARDRSTDNLESTGTNATETGVLGALLVALTKDVRHVGFGLLDVEGFTMQLCELRDDTQYTGVEALLLQSRPKDCIVRIATGETPLELKKLKTVLSRCSVNYENGQRREMDTVSEASVDMERYLLPQEESQRYSSGIHELVLAKKALAMLIYAATMGYFKNQGARAGLDPKQFSLRIFPTNTFMRLDQAAFSALHILPAIDDGAGPNRIPVALTNTGFSSLYGFLNRCRTPLGASRLRTWIVQPSLDLKEIQDRHEIVALFLKHADLRRALRHTHFRRLPNLDLLLRKLHKAAVKPPGPCTLQDVLQLRQGFIEIHKIGAILEKLRDRETESTTDAHVVHSKFIEPLNTALTKLQRFGDLVEYTLDPQELQAGRAVIQRQFHPQLEALANERDACLAALESHRAEVESSIEKAGQPQSFGTDRKRSASVSTDGAQSVKIVECASRGYVFRVTKKDQRIVQANKAEYKQVRINKNEFQFTTRRLTELVQDYQRVLTEFDAAQKDLSIKVISAASSYWPVIEVLSDLVGPLDVLTAFAEVVATSTAPYVRPKVHPFERGLIRIENGRHPLLEVRLEAQKSHKTSQYSSDASSSVKAQNDGQPSGALDSMGSIIPNTILLEKPTREVQLVTGPNMGGKSTYIRQLGLFCLMAQIGSFVPCDKAEISLVDSILCRVGASDDQLRGISTFYAEMIEASAIVKAARPNSLILVDELGRGTSTSEGLALAWEFTRHIATELHCFCAFATHFHELSQLAEQVPNIFNTQVAVQRIDSSPPQVVFLYNVIPGAADQSYGVNVAEMAHIDSAVIKRAREVSETLERLTQEHSDFQHGTVHGDTLPFSVNEHSRTDVASSSLLVNNGSVAALCRALQLTGPNKNILKDPCAFRDWCKANVKEIENAFCVPQ